MRYAAESFHKIYGREPSFLELQQWEKNRPTKSSFRTTFKSDWSEREKAKRQHEKLFEEVRQRKVEQATIYIKTTDLTLYERRMDRQIVAKRKAEVKYVIDAFALSYQEATEAINNALGKPRYSPTTIRFIYLNSGTKKV